MSVCIHPFKKYQVEYGTPIRSELTERVLQVIRNSETGWISENEDEAEIDNAELKQIIANTTDKDFKENLLTLYRNRDKRNTSTRIAVY